MNLQAEKLQLVKMIIDTDDKEIISKVKLLFKGRSKEAGLEVFYDGIKDGAKEIKASLTGGTEMKDAKAWLNEL